MNLDTTTLMLLLLVCLMVLGGALVAGASLYFLQKFLSPEPSFMQQRLMRLKEQHEEDTSDLYDADVKRINHLLRDKSYDNEALGRILDQYSFIPPMKKALYQAGLSIPVDKFLIYFMFGPFIICFVLMFLLQPIAIIFFGLGLAIPGLSFLALKFRQGQRLNKFTNQLPDALGLMTSSLRAGHSFQSAIGVIASEMPDPIGTEFSVMVNDINLGIPVKEAMNKVVSSIGLPDIRMFSTAVLIQREAGGNLAEVLDKLSYTIRERFKLKGQIASLTGQSRMTGYVLGCAPMAIFLVLFLFFPGYLAPLYETPLGVFALVVAGFMQLIGFFVMKKIIDIRV